MIPHGLSCIGVSCHFNGDAHVFPGFLTPVLTQHFFPKTLTTFLTCFCRGERRKYAGKKVHLNQGSNSQPQSHESDMLTIEPPRLGEFAVKRPVFTKYMYELCSGKKGA